MSISFWRSGSRHRSSSVAFTGVDKSVHEGYDFLLYGDSNSCTGSAATPRCFTGQLRDPESSFDYMKARYYSARIGRFLASDPSMLSVRLSNPQTWNRYPYTVNDPLRYFDPNGELWVESGNTQDPYKWVNTCPAETTCHESVAAVVGNDLRVYGSNSAGDVSNYSANEHGHVDLTEVAKHHNAFFDLKDGLKESYLSLQNAADFYNVAETYRKANPDDNKLFVTQAGNADGSKTEASRTHDQGRAIDLRYVGLHGKAVQGGKAVTSADLKRMQTLLDAAKKYGFTQNYGGEKTLNNASYDKSGGHDSHLHIGKIRPPDK